MGIKVAPMAQDDWDAVWPILKFAFAAGDSYPCPVDMAEDDARDYWVGRSDYCYVVRLSDGAGPIVGTYYMRRDQGGLGDHVCNCGYIIHPDARGQGLAVALCKHSQEEARRLGFLGMRFNLVVATNEAAVRAWKKCGMEIIGAVPKAFRHKTQGLVDAYVMYRWLGAE